MKEDLTMKQFHIYNILAGLFWLIIGYIFISIVVMSANPAQWGYLSRAVLCGWAFFLLVRLISNASQEYERRRKKKG